MSSGPCRDCEESRLEGCGWDRPGAGHGSSKPLILVVQEEERSILDDRTTERKSEVVTHVGILLLGGRIEKVARPQRGVPSKPISIPVKIIASSPSDNINDGSGVAAVLGIEVIGDDPELLCGIRVRAHDPRATAGN